MSTVVASIASMESEFQSQVVRGKKETPLYCVLMAMIEAKLLTVGAALAGWWWD